MEGTNHGLSLVTNGTRACVENCLIAIVNLDLASNRRPLLPGNKGHPHLHPRGWQILTRDEPPEFVTQRRRNSLSRLHVLLASLSSRNNFENLLRHSGTCIDFNFYFSTADAGSFVRGPEIKQIFLIFLLAHFSETHFCACVCCSPFSVSLSRCLRNYIRA